MSRGCISLDWILVCGWLSLLKARPWENEVVPMVSEANANDVRRHYIALQCSGS
jgi:hypothetical protein